MLPAALSVRLSEHFDRNHLAAFVKTTRRADAMRKVRCGTLRTGAQLWESQNAVISTALTLTAAGRLAFWYAHNLLVPI
jgi:hypothetical protein